MRRDEKILFDIADAARLVMEFTQGLDYEQFKQDIKTQSATLHQLMIVGEAAKQISEGWRNQHPEIPWTEIGRMRDHLIHRYFNVKLTIVWDAIQNDAPVLYQHLLPHVSAFLADSITTSDVEDAA